MMRKLCYINRFGDPYPLLPRRGNLRAGYRATRTHIFSLSLSFLLLSSSNTSSPSEFRTTKKRNIAREGYSFRIERGKFVKVSSIRDWKTRLLNSTTRLRGQEKSETEKKRTEPRARFYLGPVLFFPSSAFFVSFFVSFSRWQAVNERPPLSLSVPLMHWRLGPRVTIITRCTHACPTLRDRGAKRARQLLYLLPYLFDFDSTRIPRRDRLLEGISTNREIKLIIR